MELGFKVFWSWMIGMIFIYMYGFIEILYLKINLRYKVAAMWFAVGCTLALYFIWIISASS